jgi:RNA ligase
MFIDFPAIERKVAEGYINVQHHPSGDLRIYNYSAKCQFNWAWTAETIVCRGLIVDARNNIVARPFPKFFSADQTKRSDLIWRKSFNVSAKLDGSLGILYPGLDGMSIATRGSFVSEQAVVATEILRDRYSDIVVPDGVTPLFEIIFPENRIVCDYGDTRDLFLLTVIDIATGADAANTPEEAARLINWHGPVVEQYGADCKPTEVLDRLGLPQDGSVEGVVLRFDYPKGLHTRMKIKTDEYKRLHKLLTGVNARHIWEFLRDGKALTELIERVPDEYYTWARQTERGLRTRYAEIEEQAKRDFKPTGDRKETALYFQTRDNPSILFAMLDGKDYAQHIWKLIRPRGEKAFRCDIDA